MKYVSKVVRGVLSVLFILSFGLQGLQPAAAQDDGGVRIKRHPQTGKVSFIAAAPGKRIHVPGAQAQGLGQKDRALAMIQPYAADLGLKQASKELKVKQTQAAPGRQVTRFQQTYGDIPVMAGELVVDATDQGELISINGEIAPDLDLSTTPKVSAEQARSTALESLAKWRGGKPADYRASDPQLWIYDARLLQPDGTRPALVWRMDVTSRKKGSEPLNELVLVDAQRGGIILHFSQVDSMLPPQATEPPPTEVPPTEAATETPVPPTPAPTEAQATEAATETPVATAAPSEPPAALDAAGSLLATTRYVATTGTDSGTCASSAAPCLTINYALGQAAAGDTIRVAAGTYTAQPAVGSDPIVSISKSITLSGGWNSGFSARDGETILDGTSGHSGISMVWAVGLTVNIWGLIIENATSGISMTDTNGIVVGLSQVIVRESGTAISSLNTYGISNGSLIIDRSALVHNGWGLRNEGSTVSIANSTISHGGVGIYNQRGNIYIQFSTIADNSAPSAYASGIVSSSSGAAVQVANSILANNLPGDCDSNITSTGHNIFGRSPACVGMFSPHATDQVGVDPRLAPLTAAYFHPLAWDSPAINAAGGTCPATDQRGASRPLGVACAVGAVEYIPSGPADSMTLVSGSGQRVGHNETLPVPLEVLVLDADGLPIAGATVTFTAPESGASGTFADSHSNTTEATTSSTGFATSAAFTTNANSGDFDISATMAEIPGSVSFSITNIALFVATTGNDTWNCTAPATPCKTITAADSKAADGDQILVAAGTYTGTGSAPVATLSKAVSMSGGWNSGFTAQDGGDTIIDGQGARQGIHLGTSDLVMVTISRFTVQNGHALGSGGGIGSSLYDGWLVLEDSVVRNNTAIGSYAWDRIGAGVEAAKLTVTRSSITGNHAETASDYGGSGGGLAAGTLTITDSFVDDNSLHTSYEYGHAFGGGLYGGTLTMSRTTVSNNSVSGNNARGGGVYTTDGSIVNSSIFKNSAEHTGGGVAMGTWGQINNTTITANQAGESGGLDLNWVSGSAIYNTILAGNGGYDCGTDNNGPGVQPGAADHSIIGTSTCPLVNAGGNLSANAMLLSVVLGNPPYYAPLGNSPAVDGGNPATCLGTDQRGVTRPRGAACDIGAIELQAGSTPAHMLKVQGDGQSIPPGHAAPLHLIAVVVDAAGDPVAGQSVAFTSPGAGATLTFSNGTHTISVITDTDGLANSGAITANGTLGSYTVQAALAGIPGVSFSLANGALSIAAYDMQDSNDANYLPGELICTLADEGCTNGADPDADAAEAYASGYVQFLDTHFGRNSLDNAGMPVMLSVHFGAELDNSLWYGGQAILSDGWSQGDDIVAHELTHGMTEHESNLFQYYQSGAIAESLSDVFGELYDQSNGLGNDVDGVKWLIGEDVPGHSSGLRSMSNPADPQFLDPDRMTSPNYDLDPNELDAGGVHANAGINNKAAFLLVNGGAFNGRNVAPIGANKALAIYYEVNTNLLTSGSDYGDLYYALPQACYNLAGESAGITAGDCASVQNAVDAVEMNAQPAAQPDYNTDAPVCAAGFSPVSVFSDGFENGAGAWLTNSPRWTIGSPYGPYAHSGLNFMYGDDYPPQTTDAQLSMAYGVLIPSNAYLHFDHAYSFEYDGNYWDGGVLEYNANNGGWKDAGSLMQYNAYDATIVSGWGNPLGGRQGFASRSHGYISTRLNLASLGGKSVKFRWRMGLDSIGYSWGWWLDDVRIYNCEPATPNTIVRVGGVQMGSYFLPKPGSTRNNYAGVDSGPVVVTGTSPIVASIRDLWSDSTHVMSSIQVMGLPASLLSTSYYFPAYNNVSLDDQLRFGNVGTSPTWVTVKIAGSVMGTYYLLPSQSQRLNYAGVDSGPVVVSSSGGVPIIASIRDSWQTGGEWTSYSQLMGLPTSLLSTSYYFPAYNNVSLDDQIRFGNVGTKPTWVTVTIAGVARGTYYLLPSASQRVSYAGLDSGPVVVSSSGGVPIIASIRDSWWDGTRWTSYSQLMGLPASQLSTVYHFPAYENVAPLDGQLRFGNVGASPTWVTVTIGGVAKGTYYLAPSGSMRVSYPNLDSGPVKIESTGGVPIIASLRDSWWDGSVWTSYSQLMGLPNGQLSASYYFPAYNNVSLDDELRIGRP